MLQNGNGLNGGKPLTRTQIKKLKRKGLLQDITIREIEQLDQIRQSGLQIKHIKPKTINQNSIFEAYNNNKQLLIHGYPGTGKTFLALYLSINSVQNKIFNKIVIVRSAVPTRNMGFLPGKVNQKTEEYEAPYSAIFAELFNRGDAYQILKNRGIAEFMSTSYVRGITLHDCIVIVDESQNMSYHELRSIITRLGNNCKIIFCGDLYQSDFIYEDEKHGFKQMMKILSDMNEFAIIKMDVNDIVRSGLVKSFILAESKNLIRE